MKRQVKETIRSSFKIQAQINQLESQMLSGKGNPFALAGKIKNLRKEIAAAIANERGEGAENNLSR
jgi:hypothetical protein